MADRMSIAIGIRIDDINKTKTNLQAELDKIKGITAKVSKISLDTSVVKNQLQTQLNSMNFTIKIGKVDASGIDTVINKTKQATKEAEQFKNVMGKSLNIGDGAKAFDDLQRRANEIRKTVDSLAKISFNTTKNGGIKDATLTYTDNMGKLVTETMGWKQVSTDAGKTVQNIFTTLNTKVSDNVQQMNRLEAKFESIKSKMQGKLTTASALGIDPVLINQLQTQLNSLNARTPINQINQLQQQINALGNNSTANINKLQNAINTLTNRINNIKATKMNIINNNDITELRNAENELVKLKQLLAQVKAGKIIDGKLISSEINTARNSVNQLSTAINGVRSNALTLGSIFKNVFSYAVGGSAVYAGIREIRQGLTDIKNIDDSLRNLRRVSGDVADTTLTNFIGKANEMGISLGRTTEDAIDATTKFKQLGYTFEEASQYMAKNSLVLSNVGDMSASDSADSLVSILKGFRLEAQDTTKVVDLLNETGNRFAITTGQITEGLRIGGASLSIANNDLAQSTALITSGTEILRDSNMVANGLKSISMRLRGVKDEEGELVPKMREDLQAMAGVDIKNVNGSFKSTYEIMKLLGERWNDTKNPLTDLQKASIAEEVAGKQRANVFASIMQNYQQLDKVYQTVSKSAGSAQKEQEAYMNSISGKLNAFKETWKATWLNLIDSNGLKNLLTGATSLVGGLNTIIQKFGTMPTVIMSVTGAMTVFNAKFRESINLTAGGLIPGYTRLTNVFNGWKASLTASATQQSANITRLKTYTSTLQEAGMSTRGMTTNLLGLQAKLVATRAGMIACTIATVALQTALSMGLGLAISFGISKIMELANAQENLKQSNDEYVQSLQQNNPNDHQELLDNYKKLQSELSNLKQGTDEYKQKEQELATAQEQLISLYPQASTAIDENTGKKKLNAQATQELIDKEKQYAQAESIKKLSENDVKSTEDIKKLADGYTKATEEMKKYQDMYNNGERTTSVRMQTPRGEQFVKVDISSAIEKSREASEDYLSKLNLIKGALGIVEDKSGSYAGAIDIINNTLGISTDKTEKDTKTKEDNANKTNILTQANKELQSSTNGLSDDTIKKITEAYPEVENNADKAKAKVEEFNNSLKDAHAKEIQEASDAYAESAESIAKYKGILDKLNKTGEVTPQIASEALKANKELATQLGDVTSLQEGLNNKIKEQQIAQSEAYLTMMQDDQNFYQQKIANNDEFKSAYDNFLNAFVADGNEAGNIDFNNYKTYAEFKKGSQHQLGIAVENWLTQFVGESAKGYATDFENFRDTASQKASVLKKLNDQIDILNANLAGTEALKNTISARNSFYDMIGDSNQVSDPLKNFNDEVSQKIEANTSAWQAQIEKIKGAKKEIDTTFDEFGASTKGFSGGGLGGGSDFSGTGGGSGSSDKSAEKALEEAEKWKEKIAELNSDVTPDPYLEANNAITQLDNTMTSLKTTQDGLTGSELENSKKKEIEIINQQIEAYKRLQSLQEIERDNIASILSNYGILTDETGNLSNAYEVLAKKQQEANSIQGNSEVEYEAKKKAVEEVKKLSEQIEKYGEIVNNTIPKTANEYNELANSIKKVSEELKKVNEEAINSTGDKIVEGLKQEYEKKKTDELKKIEEQKEDDVKDLDNEIEALQRKLNDLDNTTADNEVKLAKLRQERQLWLKDDSTESTKKISELDTQIADLQKTIQKDSIQSQIDELNEKKSNRENDYDDEKQAVEDKYEDLLDEHKLYNEAEEMLTSKNINRIKELLSSQDESFKQIGTKLGSALTDPIQTEIDKTLKAIDDLKTSVGISSNDTSSNSSSSSSGKSKVWVSDGANTQIYTDATGTETKGSLWSNGIASADQLQTDYEYDNGFYKIYDKNGSELGWVDRTQVNEWNDVASASDGGRTPSTISNDGALMKLHKDEMIANANDTLKFDEMYNYIKNSGSLISQLSQSYGNIGNYIMPTLGTDLSDITSKIVNNNTTNTNQGDVTLIQNINIGGVTDTKIKSTATTFAKQMKQDLRSLGVIKNK